MDSTFQNERGFTLVEVMVALVIFSVIGVATFSILQKAVAARFAVKRVESELFSTSTAFSQLKNDLAQGTASFLSRVSGNADTLRLHGIFALPRETISKDVRQERVFVVSRGRPGDSLANVKLLYFVTPDENSGTFRLYRALIDENGEPHTSVLLDGIVHWQIAYLQLTGKHVSWVGAWQNRQGLPRAVRVSLKLGTWDEQQDYIYPVRLGGQYKPAFQITESPPRL
ncbi:MAG: prepilin-type N-terminal cleavage/methylation domain-containing protein [bacterium]